MQLASFPPQQHEEDPLVSEIREVILTSACGSPRSRQLALGPSEIGEPCLRKLAYRILGEPRTNDDRDPWAAVIGTATHAWLASAFTEANQRLGRIRYLVEVEVEVRPGLKGHCDLYDADGTSVLDYKIVSLANLRHYRISGPPEPYRVQANAYGMGLARLGLPVTRVAVVFFSRSSLSDVYLWSEPYNPQIVTTALARHDTLLDLMCALDVEHHPDRYHLIPATPGEYCRYCPWFSPGSEGGRGCPGNTAPTN